MEFGTDLTKIIYRGMRIGKTEWVYGYLLIRKDRCFIATNDALDFMTRRGLSARLDLVEVDPDTVGMYSHFHDCDDIKVFSGDILETVVGMKISPFSHEVKTLVLYDENIGFYANGFCDIAPYEFRFCRIIGNMHDNPELLDTVDLSSPEEDEELNELDEFIKRIEEQLE